MTSRDLPKEKKGRTRWHRELSSFLEQKWCLDESYRHRGKKRKLGASTSLIWLKQTDKDITLSMRLAFRSCL